MLLLYEIGLEVSCIKVYKKNNIYIIIIEIDNINEE